MWQPSGCFQTRNISISKHEIHVLLVDHERDYLMDMATQLKSCSYKVTTVERGRLAMSMLTKGKHELDLLLVDYNLPDLDVIKLLQVAVHLDLPTILMSEEYDNLVAEMAVNNGAILFLEKPFTKETTRNFWQYVMKERRSKLNTLVPRDIITAILEENRRYIPSNLELASLEKENHNNNRELNGVIPKRTARKKYLKSYRESDSNENYSRPSKVKRKSCTEWTEELHSRFVAAVNHLGDGRCYPKEILDLMNVPGLTRMQVASHLQKCRNDDWRAPNIQKPTYPYSMGIAPKLSIHKANIPNPRKFGAMPAAPKKRNSNYTHEREMHGSGGDKVQSFPNPSTLENQQVTLPLSQSPLPILPPPFENVNPKQFIPTPTPPVTFPPPLENVNPMRFMPTPNLQMNIDGPFGGYDFLDIPTIVMPSSDFGIDDSTAPLTQQEFGASMDPSSFNQGFDFSAFSDINLNGGDFLPDMMDGLVNNINGLPEPSLSTYRSSTYPQFVDDFTNVLTEQNAMTTNNDSNGLWNTGASNTIDQP